MDLKTVISDLKKLKLVLIFFTLLYITYIVIVVFFIRKITILNVEYSLRTIVEIFFILFKAYFIWFIWKKHPQTKQGRLLDSLMVFFLGIIGMWLWFPNKKQISSLTKTKSSK